MDKFLEASFEYREKILEFVADCNENLMEKYLEGLEITPEEMIAALREATISSKIVPVLCGTAFKNKAIQPLLDAVIYYLPSPLEGFCTQGKRLLVLPRKVNRYQL